MIFFESYAIRAALFKTRRVAPSPPAALKRHGARAEAERGTRPLSGGRLGGGGAPPLPAQAAGVTGVWVGRRRNVATAVWAGCCRGGSAAAGGRRGVGGGWQPVDVGGCVGERVRGKTERTTPRRSINGPRRRPDRLGNDSTGVQSTTRGTNQASVHVDACRSPLRHRATTSVPHTRALPRQSRRTQQVQNHIKAPSPG